MALYLDTEFNGHGGGLISLALISSKTGREFYGVVPLPRPVHPWVRENVVPVLGRDPEPRGEFRGRLHVFMALHAGEEIIADWPDDFALLMREMSGPEYEKSWMVECCMRLVASGELSPNTPHNALSDARALMRWHLAQPVAAA